MIYEKLSYLGIDVIDTVLPTLFRGFYKDFPHNTTTTSAQLLLCYPSAPATEGVRLMNPDLEHPVYWWPEQLFRTMFGLFVRSSAYYTSSSK